MRPLPQLTPANEWFWTSGADGRLRIQRLRRLRHARAPAGADLPGVPQPVVGADRGVRAGHRRRRSPSTTTSGCPGFEPPYVIAIVALAEDPTVRLTTNVVGCEPDDVHIGQEVAVRFEQHDDVWLPLFEPTGDDRPDRPRRRAAAPDAAAAAERPTASSTASVLSGVGRSAIGRRLMRDPLSLTVDACLAAVADAGLDARRHRRAVDLPGRRRHGHERGRRHRGRGGAAPAPDVDQRRRRPARARAASVIAAMLAVASGLCRHVLCFRTVWESTFAAARPAAAGGGGRVSGPMHEWRAPFGAMSAANWIGMNANQYLHRYGATREMLGLDRPQRPGQRGPQPGGHLPRPDDDGRLPVGPPDHDARSASTTATCRATRRSPSSCPTPSVAGDLPKPADPDRRRRHPDHSSGSRGTRTRSPTSPRCSASPPTSGPAPTCARPTSTSPSSTTASRSTPSRGSRRSGFCGLGEAKDWLDGGRRIALDGELPVNPHGGQLSEGRTHGFGFLYEAITQLRHDAGERQVPGARPRSSPRGGGTPSGVLLLQRDGT